MTEPERSTAETLLRERCDRMEHVYDDSAKSHGLTAYWLDGGQRLFWSLEAVREHLVSH